MLNLCNEKGNVLTHAKIVVNDCKYTLYDYNTEISTIDEIGKVIEFTNYYNFSITTTKTLKAFLSTFGIMSDYSTKKGDKMIKDAKYNDYVVTYKTV